MNQQNRIQHRGISAELVNELFASMTLENAFGLLAKMPNGFLARNVQNMLNSIKEAMKNNKLSEEDCGPKIEIYEDGLVAKHSADGPFELNCLRTVLPIPTFLRPINKARIAFYLEIEILNAGYGITIGFCDSQFPLEDKQLGINSNSNSIGILRKHEIEIEGRLRSLGEDNYNNEGFLVKDDCIGIGIIHLPNEKMEFFATWNGDLLGKVELSPKFIDLQLFPAFNLFCYVDSIRVHFKKEEWQFNDFKRVLE